jgi:hypothetical protein
MSAWTLLEKPCVTQDQNTRVTEISVTHIDREAQTLVLGALTVRP